jgi:hypothetical protein
MRLKQKVKRRDQNSDGWLNCEVELYDIKKKCDGVKIGIDTVANVKNWSGGGEEKKVKFEHS